MAGESAVPEAGSTVVEGESTMIEERPTMVEAAPAVVEAGSTTFWSLRLVLRDQSVHAVVPRFIFV